MTNYLENFEYKIIDQTSDSMNVSLRFNEKHSFVDGHFDDFKILPGAAQIGIAKSSIQLLLQKEISINKLTRTKFMGVVIPNVSFNVVVTSIDSNIFEWSLTQSETIKAKGIFEHD